MKRQAILMERAPIDKSGRPYFIRFELYAQNGKCLGAAGWNEDGDYAAKYLDEDGQPTDAAVRGACLSAGVDYGILSHVFVYIRLL